MKKEMLIFITAILVTHSFLNASTAPNEENFCSEPAPYTNKTLPSAAYSYFSLGTGPVLILPTFGVGHRRHYGYHGYDASLNYSTIIMAHQFQGSLVYHYLPNSYREDPWYLGSGVATSVYFANGSKGAGFTIAPDFVIGKELRSRTGNKHFLEMHVQAPNWATGVKMSSLVRFDFPLTYVKYGIGF